MLRKLFERLGLAGRAARELVRGAARASADRLIAQGNQAEESGDWNAACERYRKAVAIAPGYARAQLNLGIALESLGRAEDATAAYRGALASDPRDPFAHYNLAKLLLTRGANEAAETHVRTALRHRPDFPEAQIVLANVLDARGQAAAAAAGFEAALRQRPDDFGACFRYGQVLRKLGRDREAESALKRAVSLDPANVDAHAALADLYRTRGDQAAAAAHLEALLKQQPDRVDLLCDYGRALMTMHRFDEAEAAFDRALAIRPDDAFAIRVRANLLHRAGRIAELLELCRAGRARAPESFEIESLELFALNFVEEASAVEHFARHRAFGERMERAIPARFAPFAHDRDPDRPLRIGYVSGEFSFHPVSLFLIPLLERRDRSMFRVTCYSVADFADSVTKRLEAASDVWRDVSAMTEAELADTVHRDGIDILVDLAGHSGISRLGVFAEQPAPVQASWLGYLNTTGLTRIQYRISDAQCDPPGLTERWHTEALVRLPFCQWCYRPLVVVEEAGNAPLVASGHVTFGAFTQIAKLTAPMRALWARILRDVPQSRLVIAGISHARARDELIEHLAREGVAESRITLLPFMSMQDYFRSFNEVDMALDTAPYSGGTTTCDALWMGVPVLTLPGTRPASRSAASILATMGLTGWIASSPEDYVRRAVRHATDPELLTELRRTLRARMRASPLMDEPRFALDMGNAFRSMWRAWCASR